MGSQMNAFTKPFERSTSPHLDFMNPSMFYNPIGYPSSTYYYGGFNGSSVNDWDCYGSSNGVDMPPNVMEIIKTLTAMHLMEPIPHLVVVWGLILLFVDSIISSTLPVISSLLPSELVDPAVKGTLNLLQSCAKFSSVKRVVVTSSIFAVLCNRELQTGSIVNESWSSDPSYCKEHKMWYALKKILAENAASKFAKEHGIDMVTINPGLVIGPLLQPAINFSADLIKL